MKRSHPDRIRRQPPSYSPTTSMGLSMLLLLLVLQPLHNVTAFQPTSQARHSFYTPRRRMEGGTLVERDSIITKIPRQRRQQLLSIQSSNVLLAFTSSSLAVAAVNTNHESSSTNLQHSNDSSNNKNNNNTQRRPGGKSYRPNHRHPGGKKSYHHPNNNYRNTKHRVKAMFRDAKKLERQGQWTLACDRFHAILDLDPKDAHSHLALARLLARRERPSQGHPGPLVNATTTRTATTNNDDDDDDDTNTDSSTQPPPMPAARQAFERGTTLCPGSIHLWQAWAVYEESHGNLDRARELFEQALTLDQYNPYVCHAFGLMEKNKCGHADRAQALWERALQKTSTAALVCSLAELWIAQTKWSKARALYDQHLKPLPSPKEKTEVYLAWAWLEERYFQNIDRAEELLHLALEHFPDSSLAHVALARLEGRRRQEQGPAKQAAVRRLAHVCINLEQADQSSQPKDGRVFNAWANLEVRDRRFAAARKILNKGMERYPKDPTLLQAAGKVEERVGNYTAARELYSASLAIEPTAPTLVAYALLELWKPELNAVANYTYVKRLFEEALLLDPRHGPAYNAYGRAELRHGSPEEAKRIYQRGVQANCADAASIYHGYAKMELSLGNVDDARNILQEGRRVTHRHDIGMDSQHRERASFLSHTLGMLELNSNHPSDALEVFMDGIERYGNSSQLLLGAALCEAKLGKEDRARALFEKAVVNDNKHAQAWQAWGVMEMRAGNFSTARKLFDCGIRSAPTHGALWQAYATMEGRLGDIKKARNLFAAGITKAPRHVPLYQGWASLELREENFIAAKRLISEALTRDKRNGSGWLVASHIEERLGNDGLVGLILRRGIECAPTDAELYRALGEYLVRKGSINNAREIFERGLEVNPVHAPLYHSLAELEARVFNVEGLAKLNRKAAEMFNNNALEPPQSSSQVWGARIRAKRSNDVPKGITALAQKIVDDEGDDSGYLEDELDPIASLESLESDRIGDELVGELLQPNNVTDV